MDFSQDDFMYGNACVTMEDSATRAGEVEYKKEFMNSNMHMVYVGPIIGRGAFGQVCEAHANWSRHVVKITSFANRPQDLVTSQHEANMLKDLSPSQFIPKFHCFTLLDNCAYLEMEMVGKSLALLFQENPMPFDLKYALTLAIEIVNGVYFLHSKQILHLDIKCSNLCLDVADSSKIRIIDFGGCVDKTKMDCERPIWTSGYQAPESLLGLPKECATDTWSCAVVIARMFTGSLIFPTGEHELFRVFYTKKLLPTNASSSPKYCNYMSLLDVTKVEPDDPLYALVEPDSISDTAKVETVPIYDLILSMRRRYGTLKKAEVRFGKLIAKMLAPELKVRMTPRVVSANFRSFKIEYFPERLPRVPSVEIIEKVVGTPCRYHRRINI